MVGEFTHGFTDLAPADTVSFDSVWDTTDVPDGSYDVIGYVLYDGKSTDPVTVSLSTEGTGEGEGTSSLLWVVVGVGSAILLVAGVVLRRLLARPA